MSSQPGPRPGTGGPDTNVPAPQPWGAPVPTSAPPPTGHPVGGPPPRGSGERAPRLLLLAFVSAVLVAVPLLLYVVLFGVLNINLGGGSVVVLVLATLVCLVGPVLGIVAGVRAVRRCRSLPRIGGGLLVAGCGLQVLLMITLCIILPLLATVWLAMVVLIVVGSVPALLNLVGGILGLQRPTG